MRKGYPIVKSEALRTGYLLSPCLGLGLILDQPWTGLLAGLLLLLLWHLYQASRLLRWMRNQITADTNFPEGFWREIASLIHDLKERNRKRKQKLSRFFKQFRGAVASVPDAMVILGRADTIDWCNHAAETMLGLQWPADKDAPFRQRFHHPEVSRYLADGDYSTPLEFTSPSDDSSILTLSITHFGKKRYQRLIMVRDITPIRNLDRVRRDFIANISHELRTPLTVIYGYLESMQEDHQECPHWQRPLELMEQQTTRMLSVVTDLLTLSRLELNPAKRADTPINIPRILRELGEEAQTLAKASNHQINANVDNSLWLRGDDEELRSTFGNLIYNAIRHTPSGSQINIDWGKRYNGITLSISDNGEGIEPHHIPRLTERFYRVDTARSRETGGTGLGLAIVKQIVQRYGGRLTIQSTPGEGSTFSCIFPKHLAVYGDASPDQAT
jgi:two-component system phosphate regulon sensor histidine kinase PhoR